jgi:hypothetical protein
MDKSAQQRGLLNKLHEAVSPSGAMEKAFKPQFEEIMKSLVVKDDTMRSILLGKKVGKQVMPKSELDGVSVKDLLGKAKSYINQREYISAVASLTRFHKKMQGVSDVVDALDFDLSKIHHQFLFGKKMPEKKYMEHLSDFEKRTASYEFEWMIKEAGLVDSLKNLFTQRGRALRSWEKKYEDKVAPIRDGTKAQLEQAQALLSSVLEQMKTMASLRASRRVDAYVEAAKVVKSAFQAYDVSFRKFYDTVIRPEVKRQRDMENEKQEDGSVVKPMDPGDGKSIDLATEQGQPPFTLDLGDGAVKKPFTPPSNVPFDLVQRPGTQTLQQLQEKYGPEQAIDERYSVPTPPTSAPAIETTPSLSNPPSTIPPPNKQVGIDPDEVAAQLFGPKKSSYEAFVDSLEVFAYEDPSLLAAHIAKYARSIQQEQPEAAVKLFKIVKSLRG